MRARDEAPAARTVRRRFRFFQTTIRRAAVVDVEGPLFLSTPGSPQREGDGRGRVPGVIDRRLSFIARGQDGRSVRARRSSTACPAAPDHKNQTSC